MFATVIATALLALAPMHAAPIIPPCEYEDGSGQSVCRWDAHAAGNGVGESFTVYRSSAGTVFAYDNGDVYADATRPTAHALHVLHLGRNAPWCAEDYRPGAGQRVCRTPDDGGVVVTVRLSSTTVESAWPLGHVLERTRG
jgi:hypothetical protein